jgi:ribosome recycling factor
MHEDVKDGIVGVQVEVRGMRQEINVKFDEMAKRYDAISSELVRTREELTRAVNGLLKLIDEFVQERGTGKSAED